MDAASLSQAGVSQSINSERRIVTALFCDVQGSTAIAEQLDPEEWAELLNGAFELLTAAIYRYEGTVVRLLGDAVLAFFGAPIAHEDDPERAILAGLEMVEAMQRYGQEVRGRYGFEFTIRVGINTGLTVVGAVGAGSYTDYTAVGDAVNVAARMEQTAAPGTVQIAHDTYRLIAPLFEVEDLGAIEVKGKSEPVRAYRVLRRNAQPGSRRGLPGLRAPLVGRAQEMAALRQAVAGVVAGQGQIVAVMGEAGLGKSRLIAELRQSLEREGQIIPVNTLPNSETVAGMENAEESRAPLLFWLEGRSFSYETSTPYAPFASLFAYFAGLRRDGRSAEVYPMLEAALARLGTKESRRLAAYIAALMGLLPDEPEFAMIRQLDPQQLRMGIFEAVSEFISCLTSRHPTVLVFEDIHWIDPTSLDLLLSLLPLVPQTRLMLVVLFRPRPNEPTWRFHESAKRDHSTRYTALMLSPLSEETAHTLVQTLLDANDLPDSVRQLILAKAEGNPFFVEEVIRSLLDAGWLVQEEGIWRMTQDIEQISVPDTLAGVITARLDRLGHVSKQVVQTASVIGRDFAYAILAEVSGMGNGQVPNLHSPGAENPVAPPEKQQSIAELENALVDLQQRDLIHANHTLAQRAYRFKHVLTQETAYASLLLSRRRELHLRVAEALERASAGNAGGDNVIEIGRHFLAARKADRALPYFIAAGDRAARGYAAQEAIAHYTLALQAAEQVGAPAHPLHLTRGHSYEIVGEFDKALSDYEQALVLARSAQDRQSEWQALLDLGELWAARDYQKARPHLEEALALARTLERPASLAHTLNRLGNWYVNNGAARTAQQYHLEALAIFEQLGDEHGIAATHDLLGFDFFFTLDICKALEHYRRAIDLFRKLDDRQGLASALAMCISSHGYFLYSDHNAPIASAAVEPNAAALEALQISQAIHWRAGEAYSRMCLGWLAGSRGEIDVALGHLHASLATAQSIGHDQWICAAYCGLGLLRAVMLDFVSARETLEKAVALAHTIKSPLWVEQASDALATSLLWQQDWDAAETILAALLKPDTPMETYLQRRTWCIKAELLLARGDAAASLAVAERLFASMPDLESRQDTPYLSLVYAKALAELGRMEEAHVALRDAEEGARSRQWRPFLWMVHLVQAQVARRQNLLQAAEQAQMQANAVCDSIAATIADDSERSAFLARAKAFAEAHH